MLDIIKQTGCEVVLSSSWRSDKRHENQRIADVITAKGCPLKFLDVTPRTLHRHRGLEIAQWLKENEDKYLIESFCILDDDIDIHDELKGNFVHIDRKFGLTYIDADNAINILNSYLVYKITKSKKYISVPVAILSLIVTAVIYPEKIDSGRPKSHQIITNATEVAIKVSIT